MSSFFAMGGYGGFVWPAYGLTAAVLLGLWLASLLGLRQRQGALARLQAELPEVRRRPAPGQAPDSQAPDSQAPDSQASERKVSDRKAPGP